jgi:serine/threonine protein kinase
MGAPLKEPIDGARVGGKYLLTRKLATGGMGDIWIAKNEMTSADVALKILRHDIPDRKALEPRFRHEARLGAMLSHRNIVRVFDLLVESDDTMVLVMELLRGQPLRDFLHERGTLTAEEALAIVHPVLSALDHAHQYGIVHRDITPGNIFLAVDPDGHVIPKLVDFGIAKVQGSAPQTLDGRVLGTPRYMSPEQIRAEGALDGKSDLFSVGVVLMEMLTGQSPFAAAAPSASLAAVLETPVDPDPRIDPRLWLVLKQMLAKQAYERPTGAAEAAKALADAIGRDGPALAAALQQIRPTYRPTDPPPPSQASRTQYSFAGNESPTRRHRARSIALGAGLSVAALLLFGAGVLYRAVSEHTATRAVEEASRKVEVVPDAGLVPSSAEAIVEYPQETESVAAHAPAPKPAVRPLPKKKKVASSPGF